MQPPLPAFDTRHGSVAAWACSACAHVYTLILKYQRPIPQALRFLTSA
jgi:hypothetical protein